MNIWFSIISLDDVQNIFAPQNLYIAHLVCLVDQYILHLKKFSIMYLKSQVIYLLNVENFRKIYMFCQMKRDSVASLVNNNLFRSLVTTTDGDFLC